MEKETDDLELELQELFKKSHPTPAQQAEAPIQTIEPVLGVTPAQDVLTIHDVKKSYGGRMVVQGANLAVRRGEAVGLLGPNGAGKTTIFYMITGLVTADSGTVELDGYDIYNFADVSQSTLRHWVFLPQEASIFRGLTVEENIRAVLEVVEPNRKKREQELNALLDEFHIQHLRKSPSIALSGGERRRCEIARALAGRRPSCCLMNLSLGLTPLRLEIIQNLVHHLKSAGLASHHGSQCARNFRPH